MKKTTEELKKLRNSLKEGVRLLNIRLARSAIPEDHWQYGEALSETKLKLELVEEVLFHRGNHFYD